MTNSDIERMIGFRSATGGTVVWTGGR